MTFRWLRRTSGALWAVVGLTLAFADVTYGAPEALEATSLDTSAGAQVTFSGFQRGKDGDGVVFVHVTERTGFGVKHEGVKVKVRLHGASLKGRNNLHPLDLSQFNLLLLTSRLVVVDGDVELQLELRREAHLDAQWVERPDGALSLHVVVPKL